MRAIDTALKELNKKYGDEIINKGLPQTNHVPIPFSSPTLNYMTYGGIPRGGVTEFFGVENGGKTTSALDIAANAQAVFKKEWEDELADLVSQRDKYLESTNKQTQRKADKVQTEIEALETRGPLTIVYVDLEHTLDADWALKLGVDVEEIILFQPQRQSAEEVLEIIFTLMETGNVGLVVLDSLPHLVPKAALEKSLEEKTYAGASGVLADFSKKVMPILMKHNITFVGINQLRDDLASPYNAKKTPGGRAWKHLCSLRIEFKKGSLLDEKNREVKSTTENPAGNIVQAAIAKSKAFPSNRKLGQYTLNYRTGIDVNADLVQIAIRYGYIKASGAWYYLVDPDTGEILNHSIEQTPLRFQGMAKLLEFLQEDWDTKEQLLIEMNRKIMED